MSQPEPLIKTADCCLLMIDAQERLIPAISGHEGVVKNMALLAKSAAILGLDAVFTEQRNLGATLPELRGALPKAPLVEKITFSCFEDESFMSQLHALAPKTLLLAGVEAHICLTQTALHGLARGYRVQVVADATGSRDPANHQTALSRLSAAGAETTSTEMLIYELLGRAGTDQFRAVLPLVK